MSTDPPPPLVVATTKSGKTSSQIAPAVLTWDGPVVASSRKGGQA